MADALPSDCGRRLVPTLIDQIATMDPTRHFVSMPKSPDPRDGFHDVTYRCLALAIDRCAWWIERHLGSPSRSCEKLGYLGMSDIRHAIFLIACIKTGYTVNNLSCMSLSNKICELTIDAGILHESPE